MTNYSWRFYENKRQMDKAVKVSLVVILSLGLLAAYVRLFFIY